MYTTVLPLVAVGFALLYLTAQNLRSYWKLRRIPGPFWAKFTNLQRVGWIFTSRAHEIHQDLHARYGNCVRFGPNTVSIADPAEIPTVYPMRPGFPKGDFYKALMPYTKKGAQPAVFNTRDENLHKQIKSPIAPIFSLSNVMQFESFVDEVLSVLCKGLDERYVNPGKPCDFADWLQYFAFDVMGTLTFSKRYGFLEQGEDVNGMLATIWEFMKTVAPVTQMTWIDEWWNKNPWVAQFRPPFGNGILGLVGEFVKERQQRKNDPDAQKAEGLGDRDMLSRFIEIQATKPGVPDWAVTAWTFSNVIAGSDSTAVCLRTCWYNLLTHPATMQALLEELQQANLTRPYPKWNEVRDLPYLDACINEATRLHPPFCLPFERVVPKEGVTICDQFFEGGTVVGMSPYVVGRHKGTFGDDADEWRPERWMGLDEATHRRMEQGILTFGAGRRICLGKSIALLEMKKLVPTLLLNYEVNIVDPKAFEVENSWFFRQRFLDVEIKKREGKPDSGYNSATEVS